VCFDAGNGAHGCSLAADPGTRANPDSSFICHTPVTPSIRYHLRQFKPHPLP
jgi:hypothetical protein